LWIRANDKKEDGKFFEAVELSRAITRLQPRFPRVWVFHAWNMAYNISVTTQTPAERWQWVNAGVRLLRDEGIKANPREMLLYKELAWFFLHKIGGYTDDANLNYKRWLAQEWHDILGAPPEPAPRELTREDRIEQFAMWLDPIVKAPETRQTLAERSPGAAELADVYERALGESLGRNLLRRYALFEALEARRELERDVQQAGPNTQAFYELWTDPAYTDQEWADLIAFTRRRVLIDEYNMRPLRMQRLTRQHGPIDWRLPGAQSLYWASQGVEVGEQIVKVNNIDSLDFVNSYRIVGQSIQELWRQGSLYFNYVDVARGRPGYYQAVPNQYFVESYLPVLDKAVEMAGIFESEKRVYRPFAAGYENFIKDAIIFFYRRGDTQRAVEWYERLATWDGQNLNDNFRAEELSVPLEEFVAANTFERYGSPHIAKQEVFAALQGAIITGLLVGDSETFNGMWSFATQVHAYYVAEQLRDVVAGGASGARMEFMDRDFRFVAGNFFADIITVLPPDEAELVFQRAPGDLQQFAYDTIVERYRPIYEEQSETAFALAFPEPPNMEQFRTWYRLKLEERAAGGPQDINLQ
ncbi:MAG: hypothetical protein AAF995_11005, partial [Planctomycetota bacterium]